MQRTRNVTIMPIRDISISIDTNSRCIVRFNQNKDMKRAHKHVTFMPFALYSKCYADSSGFVVRFQRHMNRNIYTLKPSIDSNSNKLTRKKPIKQAMKTS